MALTKEEMIEAYTSDTEGGVHMRRTFQDPRSPFFQTRDAQTIEAFIQANPDAFGQAYAPPAVGAYYTEGGVEYTAGGVVLAEQKPQPAQISPTITAGQEMTTQRVGETELGGIILETRTLSGELFRRETVPPQKWKSMRKEHFARMDPAEKEISRLRTVEIISSQPVVEIAGKKYTMKEWKEQDRLAYERAKDPMAQFVYSISKPVSIMGAVAGGIISGAGGIESVQKHWWKEQVDIQKRLIYEPEKRVGLAFERSAEVTMLGIGIGAMQVAPMIPIVKTFFTTPMGTAAVSTLVFAHGTYQFVGQAPKAVKREITAKRGAAIEKMGVGIMEMGVGAYGLQKSWQIMYPPKPPKIKVETFQRGRALQRIEADMKEYSGIKKSEIFGTAGKRKFIGESVADYGAEIGKKHVSGFGQVRTHVKEIQQPSFWKTMKARITGEKIPIEFGKTAAGKQFFETFGVDVGKDMIFSETIYAEATGSHVYDIYHRTSFGRGLAKAGIDLTLKSMGKELKGFGTTTQITDWLSEPPKLPSKSVSYLKGPSLSGADITDIIHIIEGPSLSTTGVGGVSTKITTKTVFTGIAEVGTGLGKIVAKDMIKGIITQPPPPAKTYAFAVLQPPKADTKIKVISGTKSVAGLKVRTKTKTKTGTRLGTRMGAFMGTRMGIGSMSAFGTRMDTTGLTAIRLDTKLAQRLDTRLGLKMDTRFISPMAMTTPISPLPTIPTGFVFGGIGGFGAADFFKRKKRKVRRLRRKTIPEPSLGGIVLGKVGKLKPTFTGIEPIRPIGIKMGKKRKKKKKRKSNVWMR